MSERTMHRAAMVPVEPAAPAVNRQRKADGDFADAKSAKAGAEAQGAEAGAEAAPAAEATATRSAAKRGGRK